MIFYKNNNLNKPEVVQEVYYGKKPQFKECERLLDILIQRMHSNFTNTKEDVTSITSSPENQKIEKLFKEAFDLNDFKLNFYTVTLLGIEASPNAFVLCDGLAYFKKDLNDKENKRINPKLLNATINVDVNLVTKLNLTSGELMAAILHELGHCMQASLAQLAETAIQIASGAGIFGIIIGSIQRFFINGALRGLSLLSDSFPGVSRGINRLKSFISDVIDVVGSLYGIGNLLSTPILFVMGIMNPMRYIGYAKEKFADSFATSYGYGKDLSSFLNKLDTHQGNAILKNNRSVFFQFTKLCNDIAISQIDEHPPSAVRIRSQINKLKRDLKNGNVAPEDKKELMQNIKDLEEFINSEVYEESTKPENRRKMRVFMNKMIIDKKGGYSLLDIVGVYDKAEL